MGICGGWYKCQVIVGMNETGCTVRNCPRKTEEESDKFWSFSKAGCWNVISCCFLWSWTSISLLGIALNTHHSTMISFPHPHNTMTDSVENLTVILLHLNKKHFVLEVQKKSTGIGNQSRTPSRDWFHLTVCMNYLFKQIKGRCVCWLGYTFWVKCKGCKDL